MEMIKGVVDQMKEDAIKKHGLFNSDSEYYAVLKEECEELSEEATKINKILKNLWGNVRKDERLEVFNEGIEKYANRAIFEALQVLAVIEKYKETIKMLKCVDCQNFSVKDGNETCLCETVPKWFDEYSSVSTGAAIKCISFKRK